MNNQTLKDYFELKQLHDDLGEQIKTRQAEVLTVLLEQPEKTAEIEGAKFSVRTTLSYKYSADVETENKKISLMKKIVTQMQKAEVSEGSAKIVKEVSVPVVRSVKGE